MNKDLSTIQGKKSIYILEPTLPTGPTPSQYVVLYKNDYIQVNSKNLRSNQVNKKLINKIYRLFIITTKYTSFYKLQLSLGIYYKPVFYISILRKDLNNPLDS